MSSTRFAFAPLAPVRDAAAPLWRRGWGLALAVLLAYISWQAVRENPVTLPLHAADKLLHLLAFATLAVPTALLLERRTGRAWRVLAWLVAYGVAIELVQAALPHRSAEALDVLADTLGVVLGLVIVRGLEAWAGVPPAARR